VSWRTRERASWIFFLFLFFYFNFPRAFFLWTLCFFFFFWIFSEYSWSKISLCVLFFSHPRVLSFSFFLLSSIRQPLAQGLLAHPLFCLFMFFFLFFFPSRWDFFFFCNWRSHCCVLFRVFLFFFFFFFNNKYTYLLVQLWFCCLYERVCLDHRLLGIKNVE